MRKLKTLVPVLFTFLVIFLFYVKRIVALKFYPPICNFIIFLVFFCSLFAKETLIEKFARLSAAQYKPSTADYARKVNYIWCVFTFLNFLISVWTIFLADNIWMIYNGCVSYLLVGLVFGIEYIVRITLIKRNLI
jgi:uncharacterized membrane protein